MLDCKIKLSGDYIVSFYVVHIDSALERVIGMQYQKNI